MCEPCIIQPCSFPATSGIDLSDLGKALELVQRYVKNKHLLRYAVTLPLLHRTDVSMTIPSQITYSPYLYFDMGNLHITQLNEDEVSVLHD